MAIKVPELVVVLLCILGAGAVVTVFAAFGKSIFGSKDVPATDFNQRSPEQDSYLRRVRESNQLAIWGHVRSQRREQRRQRERAASDIEIQSGRSNSNAGRHWGGAHSQHSGGYHTKGYGHHAPPVAYYEEEEFAEYGGSNVGYGERPISQPQQSAQYAAGYSYQYVTNPSKPGPTETWNEVPR